MASINAATAGGGGVITTSDASGNLNIQSGGSTVVAVTSTGVAVTGTLAATGTTNLGALTTTGNTILGDASTDTLNVGNGGLVKDASGNVLIGTSSQIYSGAKLQINGIIAGVGYGTRAGTTGSFGANSFNINWTGSAAQLWIDSSNLGTITIVSDYRLKQKVETQATPALDRVLQLRPITYEFKDYGEVFKADGVAREGFIAHELQAVIPSAVEGEKDAENQIQSLKLDALCSVMVKAIQEQQALIAQLQADVAALKELSA